MKKIFISLILIALILPVFGQNQDEYKFSLVPRRVAVPSLTGYLRANGLDPLTADWANPLFSISANNLTATPTSGAEMNDNFASWTAAAGWTYGSGKWAHSSGTTQLTDDKSTLAPTIGQTYKIVVGYTWAGAGSTVIFNFGGQSFITVSSAAASSVTYYVKALSTGKFFAFPSTGFTGSINSLSVTLSAGGDVISGDTKLTPSGIVIPRGNVSHPSLRLADNEDTGLEHYSAAYPIAMVTDGYASMLFGTALTNCGSTAFQVGILNLGNADTTISRESTGVIQFMADAAAPVATVLHGADATGDDHAGGAVTIAGGFGTDTGVGGSVKIATAPAGAVGSNNGTLVERMEWDSTGAEKQLATNGAYAKRGWLDEEITLSTTGATSTSTKHLIPANSIIECVTTRFTEAANNITNWSIGDGTDVDRFMPASTTFTLGATTVNFNHWLLGGANIYSLTDEHIVITTTGPQNTTGKIRVTVFYKYYNAPQT